MTEALEAPEVAGDLPVVVGAGLVVVGTEVVVAGRRARERAWTIVRRVLAVATWALPLPRRLARRR